jgi:taurine transport system permease protein
MGQPIAPGETVRFSDGERHHDQQGQLSAFQARPGWQMEPIWLPAPEAVASRFFEIASEGYQELHPVGASGLFAFPGDRGLLLRSLIGIPLGYAMGLSNWFRGWFDPIVEFMRPVPPLALIPLSSSGSASARRARSSCCSWPRSGSWPSRPAPGVSGVQYFQGARGLFAGRLEMADHAHVIVPNSLPEIFTGARVAMGVCWGTVVAAELVAARRARA